MWKEGYRDAGTLEASTRTEASQVIVKIAHQAALSLALAGRIKGEMGEATPMADNNLNDGNYMSGSGERICTKGAKTRHRGNRQTGEAYP
jgi:hypothetical protein